MYDESPPPAPTLRELAEAVPVEHDEGDHDAHAEWAWRLTELQAAATPAAVLALYAERDTARALSEGRRESLITYDAEVLRLRAEGDQLRAALREAQQTILSFASIPRPYP